MYLMAASMAVLGPSIASARVAGALCGALAILAQFILVRSLPIARAQRVALLSAGFLALTFWPIAQARYALRANLLPVWVALAIWAWWKAVDPGEDSESGLDSSAERNSVDAAGAVNAAGDSSLASVRTSDDPDLPNTRDGNLFSRNRHLWPILAGVFIALAIHTHLTGRVLILIFVASALWRLVRDRRVDQFAPLLIAGATTLLLAWPQIRYFQTHPDMLSHRANQVSLLNPEVNEGDLPYALFENGINLLEMPVLRGDSSWYHNIKRRPIWPEPPAALAFLIGLGLALRLILGLGGRRAQLAAILLTGALGVTTAPSLLSMGAPNYVRLTGTWPILFLLPALGLDAAMAFVSSRPRLPQVSAALLGALTLIWLGASSANDYFEVYAQEPEVYTVFNASAVERAQHVADVSTTVRSYASPALWNQSVIRFVTLSAPPQGEFDMLQGLILPPLGGWDRVPDPDLAARYLFDPVEAEDAVRFGEMWPGMKRRELVDRAGHLSLIVYELSKEEADRSIPTLPNRSPAIFGGAIRLTRSDIEFEPAPTGSGNPGSLHIQILWQSLATTETDQNYFLHVLALDDDRSLAQFDGPPLGGSHPTDRWPPGEAIYETHWLPLSEPMPEAGLKVMVGWYDWRDGTRMEDSRGEGGAVELGRLLPADEQ
jgi:4-amino-4-deoxy-L-arabinose transferase-like glycosyltransferase